MTTRLALYPLIGKPFTIEHEKNISSIKNENLKVFVSSNSKGGGKEAKILENEYKENFFQISNNLKCEFIFCENAIWEIYNFLDKKKETIDFEVDLFANEDVLEKNYPKKTIYKRYPKISVYRNTIVKNTESHKKVRELLWLKDYDLISEFSPTFMSKEEYLKFLLKVSVTI